MSATINIVETTTELGIEVVEVTVTDASAPGPAGPGVPTGGTDGQVLTKASGTDYDTAWEDATGGAGGAPDDVDYLVGTASGDLSAEIVVGTSPGGELGGTWASPTVDATHSGSSHAAVQAAAEATAAAALTTHTADTTAVHGIADTSALVVDGDAAGGVLGGTYPNPSFAADMATQAELDAHIADSSAAHAATAISFTPDGSIAATTVQAAIVEVRDEAGGGGAPTDVDYLVGTASGGLSAEIVVGTSPGGELGGTWASPTVDATHSGSSHAAVQAAAEATAASALSAHVTDTSAAHAASAISADSTTLVGTGTDVQAVLEELDNGIADHLADTSDAHDASAISVADSGGLLTATDVEAALAEIYGKTKRILNLTTTTTSDTSVTATSLATAETFVTAGSVTLNGSTRVEIEIYIPQLAAPGGGANRFTAVGLYAAVDGGAAAAIGTMGLIFSADTLRLDAPALFKHIYTPSAGAYVYSARVYVNGGTGQALISDSAIPAYIKVSTAP
jgi:hypothetical protein